MMSHYIGTQISLISFHRFGVRRILDALQESCGLNAVRIHADTRVRSTAEYHDLESEEPTFNLCGLPLDERNYRAAPVRSQAYMGAVPAQDRLALLSELREEMDARGMQLQVRNIVGPDNERDSFSTVLTRTLDGQVGHRPCWNNPYFIAFMHGVAEDVFRTAPIRVDGYVHMAEYSGANPLAGGHLGETCFCRHCCERGARENIDVNRAKEGFRAFRDHLRASAAGDKPLAMTGYYRLLMRYPEVLAWDRMQWDAYHEVPALVRGIARHCNPDAQVGVHVHHSASWHYAIQAGYDYAAMAEYCDFVKPIIYTTFSGMRAGSAVSSFHQHFMPQAPRSEADRTWKHLHGLDPERHPVTGPAESEFDGADYVGSEVRRIADELQGRCPIYANVGWHVEWDDEPEDPRTSNTYRSTMAAIEAGAQGIFLSRQLCPDAMFGGVIEGTAAGENSAGGAKQKVEGDVGDRSLRLYGQALRDAGWIS